MFKSIVNFFKKLSVDDESKTEKIMEERSEIKKQMEENLRKLNFTTIETKEVLNLISTTERKIETLKVKLIGSNINNDDPMPFQEKILGEIKELQQQLQLDIRAKVQEIRQRKIK